MKNTNDTAFTAVRGARNPRIAPKKVLQMLAGLPGALLVPGLCPACWPAYVGILSAFGLGFVLKSWVLLPLFLMALLLALGSLAWKAHGRHGYGPLGLGILASIVLLAGQFALDSDILRYLGAAVLFAACVWNGWPGRSGAVCPNCGPADNRCNETVKSNGENK